MVKIIIGVVMIAAIVFVAIKFKSKPVDLGSTSGGSSKTEPSNPNDKKQTN